MEAESGGHAFISYVHEDAESVDRVQRILEAAGVRVWRDTADLWPGEDWKIKIREAITENALAFIACFSDASLAKEKTYQNEELLLAVEQLRLRKPDQPWLIPVRFTTCDPPDFDLGAGRTMGSLQRVDLFGEKWDTGGARLVAGTLRILSRTMQSTRPALDAPASDASAQEVTKFVKSALLNSTRQIELEDFVMDRANAAATTLLDEQVFPATSPAFTNDVPGIRYLADQAHAYWDVVSPLIDVLIVGCTWGTPEQNSLWARVLERVANTAKDGAGQTALIEMRRYPILPLLYAGGIAAVHRNNFSTLKALVTDARFRHSSEGAIPMIGASHVWRPFAQAEVAAQILALDASGEEVTDVVIEELRSRRKGGRYTPVSDHLHDRLREHLRKQIPDDDDYTETFDALEVLLGVIATDAQRQAAASNRYLDGAWFGSFTWRSRRSGVKIEDRLRAELEAAGETWAPLVQGLFGGSLDRAVEAFDQFNGEAGQARRQ
jgi:hypothetical protein